MKITVFAPKAPWIKEGQPKVLAEHNKRLNLEIYCTDPERKESGTFRNVKVYNSYFKNYLFSPKLFLVPKKEKILAHGFTTFLPLVALFKSKEFYLMPHYHSQGSTKLFKLLRLIYDPTIGSLIIRKAKKIFCVSDYEKKELIKKYGASEKFITIYNGINTQRFNRAKPFANTKDTILYVGRLEKYKNIHLLIKSMEYLPEFKLKVIGSGPYKKNLKKIVSTNNVEFLEGLDDLNIARWMKSCSLFVTLSGIEAFGLTVIEALASGKPVLVNNSSSLKDFVGIFSNVNGIDLNSLSIKELAEEIRKSSKIKIKEEDLTRFRWDIITKKIEMELC